MPLKIRSLILLAGAILPGGCGPSNDVPQRPVTLSDLEACTISHLQVTGETITLRSGYWEGAPRGGGGAARPSVRLLKEITLSADLDGTEGDDAVAFLAESSGGSGVFLTLALIVREGDTLCNPSTVPLGDRVQLREARIDSGAVIVDLVQAGQEDALCCPGELVRRSWVWREGTLVERPVQLQGRLSLELLSSGSWTLVAWTPEEPTSGTAQVTLMYAEGRFAGSAGCNRYFASVAGGESPGEIAVGHAASTRMMCEPEVMKSEDRFLSILPRVTRFGFVNGRLFLSYPDSGGARTLLLGRTQADDPSAR